MEPYSVIITHYRREGNLNNTLEGLDRQTIPPSEVIIVEMGDGLDIRDVFGFNIEVVQLGSNWDLLPLAAARNIGALSASTGQLVFLDVDCIPSDSACEKMVSVGSTKGALAMGQPKYLLRGGDIDTSPLGLVQNSIYHPARPFIEGFRAEESYELFWSLCFSISVELFESMGGFDEEFEGYGAEDTDFALRAKRMAVPFYLTDAEVYHQQHPIYIPPLNHLVPIVNNSNLFHAKWGYWPMADCLNEFSDMGYIEWHLGSTERIEITARPSTYEISRRLCKNAPYR